MINTFFWILAIAALVYGFSYFMASRMWALKQIPHDATPESLGISFDELNIPTENQKSLYAWWIPSDKPEAPLIVLVHGWSRNLSRTLRYIQHLHPKGYNLLAFDARHHGSSDADGHASMYKFGQDILSVVRHAREIHPEINHIGVVGLSIGGAGSVYAASQEPAIDAVVTVGSPSHPVDIIRQGMQAYHVPELLIKLMLKQIEWTIGVPFTRFAPRQVIAQAKAHFLVIHGLDDTTVAPSHGKALHDASRSDQTELWEIIGRGHSNCHHEPGFWDKVDTFFQTHFQEKN